MDRSAVRMVGFWAAVLAFVFSNLFTIGAVVGGMLPKPWDTVLPVLPSLLLAPTWVTLMLAVYHAAPDERKLWAHLGVAAAILYASLASVVYVTWLFVVEPRVMRGDVGPVAPFVFGPGTFLQMLDGLAYTYSCLAAFCTAFVFVGQGIGRWLRWIAIANGIFAIPVFLSYVFNNTALGIWWSITIPAYALLAAIYFRRGDTTLQVTGSGRQLQGSRSR